MRHLKKKTSFLLKTDLWAYLLLLQARPRQRSMRKVASVVENGRNHQDNLVAESAKLARELEEQDQREQKLQRHLENSRKEIEELRQQIRERDVQILKLNH